MTSFSIDMEYLLPRTPIDASDVTVPIYDLIPIYKGIVDGNYDFIKGRLVSTTPLTISGDAITPTQSQHRLLPQSGTADQLKTVGHSGTGPDILLLQLNTPGDEITFVHGVGGNLWMSDGRDIYLNDVNRMVELVWNNTEVLWSVRTVNYDSIRLADSTLNFISSGIAVVQTTRMELVPEVGLTDDLITIQNPPNYDVLLLVPSGATDIITVKHNVGNIFLSPNEDLILNGNNDGIVLIWNNTTSKWNNAAYNEIPPSVDFTSRDGSGLITIGSISSAEFEFALLNNVTVPMTIPSDIVVNVPSQKQLFAAPRIADRKFAMDYVMGGAMWSLGMTGATVATGTGFSFGNSGEYLIIAPSGASGNVAYRRSQLGVFQYTARLAFEAVCRPANPINDADYLGRYMIGFLDGIPVASSFAGRYGIWFDFITDQVSIPQYVIPRIVVMQNGTVIDTITTFNSSPGAIIGLGGSPSDIQYNSIDMFRFSMYIDVSNTIYARVEAIKDCKIYGYWEASKSISGMSAVWTALSPRLAFGAGVHVMDNGGIGHSMIYSSMHVEGF